MEQSQGGENSSHEELDSLRSVNSTLSSEVANLRSKLEEQAEHVLTKESQWHSDKAALESKYMELVKKAKKWQSELKVAREKVSSQDAERKGQVEEKEKLNNKISVLTSRIGSLEEVKGETGKEQSHARARCLDLEAKVVKGEEAVATLQEELGSALSDSVSLKEQLAAAQSHTQDVEEEVEELRKNLTTLDRQLSDSAVMEGKCKSLLAELSDALKREAVLKDEVGSLQTNLNSNAKQESILQQEKEKLKERMQEEENTLESERSRVKMLMSTKLELEKSLGVSQQRAREVEGDCQHLQTELQHSDEKRKKAEDYLISVQQELAQATSDLAASQEELSCSRSQLSKLESETSLELNEMRSLLKESEEKMVGIESKTKSGEEKLARELDSATSHCRELEEQLNSEREERKNKIAKLQGALDAENSNLTATEKEKQTLQSALEVKSQECLGHLHQLNSLQANIAGLQDKLHRKEAEFEVFQKDQVDGQKDHSFHLEARIRTLQEQNERLSQERDNLKVKVGQSSDELENLRRHKTEADAEMLTAREAMEKELLEIKALLDKTNSSHGEESKKLKVYAAKMKKELAETKEQVSLVAKWSRYSTSFDILLMLLQLVSLQKEHQSVQDKMSREAGEQSMKVASLSEETEALVASLQEQVHALQAKCDKESDKASKALEESENYRVELEALRELSTAEAANLQSQLTSLSSSQGEKLDLALSEKDKQLHASLEELQSVRTALQAKSQECIEVRSKYETLQLENNQLQQKREDVTALAKKETGDVEQKLSVVEHENLQLRKDYETVKEEYKTELENLRQAKDSVDKDLVKAQEAMEAAERSRKVEAEQAKGVQEKEAVSHREENRKLKAFAMKLKKELADTRERVSVKWNKCGKGGL